MNLVIDIGNTRTKAAIFHKNKLQQQAVWDGQPLSNQLAAWISHQKIEKSLLSAVATPNEELLDFFKKNMLFEQLTHQTPLPFQNRYATPETLGKDRLAAVAGAKHLFPQKNVVVIDFGTCIKYEWLDAQGNYWGGNISPGAAMRLQAMQHFTERLPLVDFRLPKTDLAIGNTTETALQLGGLRGVIYEVDGFLRQFLKQHQTQKIVLTGGDAYFFQKYLPFQTKIQVEPNLVLIGLNTILNHLKL